MVRNQITKMLAPEQGQKILAAFESCSTVSKYTIGIITFIFHPRCEGRVTNYYKLAIRKKKHKN